MRLLGSGMRTIAILTWAIACAPTLGQEPDAVTIATERGGTTVLTGRVVDWTGRALRLVDAHGQEHSITSPKVVDVKTSYVPAQNDAAAARAARRFDQALALYRRALETETRSWVRRRILVEMTWCYRGLGQTVPAGQTALVAMRGDPGPSDFACLPLAWSAAPPTAEVEQAARQWLVQDDPPAAALLGASHLLGVDRPAALARLKRLAVEADGPVARLAQCQIWRTEIVAADAAKTAVWQTAIETVDPPLRAGPYFVLGQALGRRREWEAAALALLRVPIQYPDCRDLAAEALWDAGRALEKAQRPIDAARLYRELVERYPEANQAAEARERLEKK
ncbi:MAG: hypothetical protein JW809_04335 [Pirellulales bacterium]|nr:hypothetical protein [Pirellulales bacterium]